MEGRSEVRRSSRKKPPSSLRDLAPRHWRRNLPEGGSAAATTTSSRHRTQPPPPPPFLQTSPLTREIWKGVIGGVKSSSTSVSPLSMFLGHEHTVLRAVASFLDLPLDPCSCCRIAGAPVVYCCSSHRRYVVDADANTDAEGGASAAPDDSPHCSAGEVPDSLLVQIHGDVGDEILSCTEYMDSAASAYGGSCAGSEGSAMSGCCSAGPSRYLVVTRRGLHSPHVNLRWEEEQDASVVIQIEANTRNCVLCVQKTVYEDAEDGTNAVANVPAGTEEEEDGHFGNISIDFTRPSSWSGCHIRFDDADGLLDAYRRAVEARQASRRSRQDDAAGPFAVAQKNYF